MESVKVVIISEDTSIRVNLKKKLADKDIPRNPCSMGAQTKLVNASAMAKREPFVGSIIAATGA